MQRLLPRRRPAPLWLACALLVAALLVLVAAAARAGAGGRAWLLAAGEQAEPSTDREAKDVSETGVPLPSVLWLALRSGGSAARAGAAQVALLMWLRTLLNFQYAKGGTLGQALSAVRAEAGGSVAALVARLYRGAGWALLQAPASRFGDAAANELALRLFGGRAGPAAALSALLGGMWRVTLMPIDSLKTLSQVHGAKVGGVLSARLAAEGVGALYAGAVATLAASALGHYPWFFVFNLMDNVLPHAARGSTLATACRNALRGLCASCASDVCSNAARVLKAARQAAPERAPTYLSFARGLLARKGGAAELFGRALGTRLLCNCVQSALFAVIWRGLMQP